MNPAFKLYRLQQLDSQLDKHKAQLEEIRAALQDDRALRLAEGEAQRLTLEYENTLKALRKTESAVQDQRIKIETTEASLYGGKVRNPKELQDLQNEAASLKRYQAVLEDRQLEAMVTEEEAGQAREAAQAALREAQNQYAQKQSRLAEEEQRLLREQPDLDAERQAAASQIPPNELQLYENLRRQKRGVGVSLVKNKACTACGSTLSATLLDATMISGLLTRCETCGRILYAG